MQSESPLADVKAFLRDILVQEKLSCTAEKERLRLLRFLDSRESSPAPYINMSPNNKNSKTVGDKNETNQCYEEFSSTKNSNSIENGCDKSKDSSKNSSARSSGSLYYNITQAFKSSSAWDVNEDKPFAPQKDSRNSLSNSSTASNRNSMCSLTIGVTKKSDIDTTDTVSEASSSASNNLCSSKNTNNAPPEVLTISASALRYSASKCGILSRKEKFLFLDHYKQYWAGLLGHTLYVYCSDKDSKPVLEVNIEGYQARPVGLKDTPKKENSFEIFCPGNKTYQFTAPCASEMDQWISVICQAGKVPENSNNNNNSHNLRPTTTKSEQTGYRRLPSLPVEMMYDKPDSIIRPVTPSMPEQYEAMNSNVDDVFYHYISNDMGDHINEKVLYKNLQEMSLKPKESEQNVENYDENFYYNLVPTGDGEQECIYDTIREAVQGGKTIPVLVSGRIQQIIQQIEAQAAAGNSSKHTSLIQDELYEPVNTPEETSVVGRTVSR